MLLSHLVFWQGCVVVGRAQQFLVQWHVLRRYLFAAVRASLCGLKETKKCDSSSSMNPHCSVCFKRPSLLLSRTVQDISCMGSRGLQ